MSQVQDSHIFSSILSTPASAAIWTDKTRTSYYLLFEASLAKVQAQLNIIPQRAADEIIKYCDISIIVWDLLKEKTERIGYPVLGVVQQLVSRVNRAVEGEELGEWAHWGATTQVCMFRLVTSIYCEKSLNEHANSADLKMDE